MKIHEANGHDEKRIMLSVDGVSESKSTTTTLLVYSIKFRGCRDVYPIKIVRPLNKFKIDNQKEFCNVLDDINEEMLDLEVVVADNPMRSFVRNSMHHGARFGCEYCFRPGFSYCKPNNHGNDDFLENIKQQIDIIREQIEALDEENDAVQIQTLQSILENLVETEEIARKKSKYSHIVWPASTVNGEIRTKDKILDIVEQLESGYELDQLERKGIKGRSLLLNLDNFDYVNCIITEYMHLVCLGVVKRLLELTFSVGEKRTRITKRPLTSPQEFDEAMKRIKVFHECSRRARKLDLSVMKAQELRNILLFYFPVITNSLTGNNKEIKVWEMLAFMIRACVLPEIEYSNVNVNLIKYCQKHIYVCYEQLFGMANCTYSVHVMSSHLLKMRSLGTLTETSAFRFEAFYAELRHAFQPGTVSVVKQMFQNVLLKRMLSRHVCQESIHLSPKETALESNSLIYVYENNTHLIYKIKSIENDILTCNQIGNHEITFPNTDMLNWSSVGVYRKGGMSSENVLVNRNDVAGKVLKVQNCLITCPNNVLREK